jgi:hypothetical protein
LSEEVVERDALHASKSLGSGFWQKATGVKLYSQLAMQRVFDLIRRDSGFPQDLLRNLKM